MKLAVPGGGEIFPSYHLNQIYDETDVFESMAELKNHAGVYLWRRRRA